jgi:FixJ family two-component response regulator
MARTRLPAYQLTPREREVQAYINCGCSNAMIAQALCVAPKTVESHIRNIYAKQREPLQRQGPARRIEYLLHQLQREGGRPSGEACASSNEL